MRADGSSGWGERRPRLRHGLSSVALVCSMIAAAAVAAPSVAVAAPAGCGWLTTAENLLASLQGRTDQQSTRLRQVLQNAIATCPSGTSARPYFTAADWLWDPIPQDPVLDPNSKEMAASLAEGDEHIADIDNYSATLVGPDQITAETPRYSVSLTEGWCSTSITDMPIPEGTKMPGGSDGHLAVLDEQRGTVFNLWAARKSGEGWSAGCGSQIPVDGDGREPQGSTSTGSNLARFAAVVRADEIAKGEIPHAMFFSTDMATSQPECRYPAAKTDGSNDVGGGTTIPEGARVQLDPSVDVDSLGLSAGERTVAKALQTYGAYVGDNGGARIALIFEYAPDSDAYTQAGLHGDAQLNAIPWDKLRVLKSWNGAAEAAGTCGGAD